MNYLANNSKRLPPYGNEVALFLSRGAQPKNDIFIFAGINAGPKINALKKARTIFTYQLNATLKGIKK